MGLSHAHFKTIEGQEFYKLMGAGRGLGFNPWPDFSTYALVQVWKDERQAQQFFNHAEIMHEYEAHAQERWTLLMRSITAKGFWSGINPFEASTQLDLQNPYLAIITRATIRKSKLWSFWRYVPTSHKPLKNQSGLLFTKGIGEIPIVQMATFSLWDSLESLESFAHRSKEHRKAIKLTRELNWYSEELFSRFQPYKSYGTWQGTNPLPDL